MFPRLAAEFLDRFYVVHLHLMEIRRDPSRHRGAPCDVTMRYIECDPRILRKMFEDVI